MRALSLFGVLILPLFGQGGPGTIFYATDDIRELSASGAGGTASNPGNSAAVFDNDGLVMVEPNPTSSYFGYAAADHSTWLAYFGDEDNDGNYIEYVSGDVSALYVPPSAPNPPTIFDVFISFDIWIGGWGVNGSSSSTSFFPGDVVKLNRGGTWTSFLSRAQIGPALGITSSQVKNVDALVIDEATGDLYFSFESATTVNGTPLEDGGIVRLPSASYTTDPAGMVATVQPGSAEIVVTEAEVDGICATAGLSVVENVQGLIIDPNGGTYFSAGTGFSMPNLVFSSFGHGPRLISTSGGGSIWVWNGVTFDSGMALGMANTNFAGTATGKLSALAFRAQPLAATPRHLDVGWPVSVTTPGSVKVDISGATPNGTVLLVASLAEATVVGGYTARAAVTPTGPLSVLDVPGAFGEFYHLDTQDPLFSATIMDVPVAIDGMGYGSRTYPVPTLPPGFAVVFQGLDVQAFALTSPVIPVTL